MGGKTGYKLRRVAMLKTVKTRQFLLNVKIKNGRLFEAKDIPTSFLSDHERWIAFWHNGRIRAYPIQDVEYYELVPQEPPY